MAYSRFGESRWYTYWQCGGGNERDKQIFDICPVKSFTYAELKSDMDGCIDKIRDSIGNSDNPFVGPPPTNDELDELREYMKWFIEDVEKVYGHE